MEVRVEANNRQTKKLKKKPHEQNIHKDVENVQYTLENIENKEQQ